MTESYSILMAVYDRENPEYLKQSFDSILNQSLPAEELVLVCDGPLTAPLNRVIDEYARRHRGVFRIVPLSEHTGLGPALNEGLKHCNCEYVAHMDSDDISCLDRCKKQLAFMREKQLDLSSGIVAEFKSSHEKISAVRTLPETHEELVRFSRRRSPMNHPCVMFRKSKVIEAGSYREMPLFEDYDLWIRMIQKGARLGNMREVLLYMRSGQEMFRRRGGFKYARAVICFWTAVYSGGFIGILEYLFAVTGRVMVSLLPNTLRVFFYRLWLREV